MLYLTKTTFITVLFFFSVALFFLFKLPTQVDAQFLCFFDDSDCPIDRICLANFCVQINNCDGGFCNGPARCTSGFHFANHACVQDFVCDSSNVIPQNFGAVGGGVIEPCDTLNCGAQCQDNTDCTAFQNGTCSGAPACACNYPVCPAPTNLSCSQVNPTQVRGDWTQSAPVANYLLEACPVGQPPTSPSCIQSAPPLTSGSFDFVDVSPSTAYDLFVRVENNTGSFCVPPSNWSGPARCPTPTPTPTPTNTPTPTPTNTPTPTPTPQPCDVSGRVWFDDNDDNIPQVSESGVQFAQVVALPPIGASYPPVSEVTNFDGTYAFTNLVCDYYDIVLTSMPPGYRMSTGSTNVQGVLLPPARTDINFGIVPMTCRVTTSPAVHNLNVGDTGTITASVTSGQGASTILQMRFGSYNTSIATVNPTSDTSSIYSTTVTAVAAGATAVWATADLDDNFDGLTDRNCPSIGPTDTDVNVTGPTPTPQICARFCTIDFCTLPGGSVGVFEETWASCGPGCCGFVSQACVNSGTCPVPPTPIPPPPTQPPTPTPIAACPAGSIEKTVLITSQNTSCAGGAACTQNSDCCSNSCSGSPYFTCNSSSVTGAYGTNRCYSSRDTFCPLGVWPYRESYSTGNFGSVFAYVDTLFDSWGRVNGYRVMVNGAVLNFNGLSIPKGSTIRKATVFSSSGGFQAGFIGGKVGNTSGWDVNTALSFGSTSYPGLQFGSGRIAGVGCVNEAASWCQSFRGELTDWGNYCIQSVDPFLTGGNSGLPSGTGDVTSFVQSAASTQDLTALSFSIQPDYIFINPFGSCFKMDMAGNFSVSSNSTLGINFCEPTYSISGNVFEDDNSDQLKNGAETNYSAGLSNISIHTGIDPLCFAGTRYLPPTPLPLPPPCVGGGALPGGTSCSNNSQCCSNSCPGAPYGTCTAVVAPTSPPIPFTNPIFTATGDYATEPSLLAGQYTVCYNNLPAAYDMTFPTTTPIPNLNVVVGPACSPGTSNSAICDPPAACKSEGVGCATGAECCSGVCGVGPYLVCTKGPPPATSIKNANFGIVERPIPPDPWFQSIGTDMRIDVGLIDLIPVTAVPPHASLVGTGGTPGIIFSGRQAADFGVSSQASTPNWKTGDFSTWKSDVYTASRRSVPTSYGFLLATAQSSGIPLTDIQTPCGGSLLSCTLPAGFLHGIYIANGDLNLNSYNFTGGNFIILVNGNLTINGGITVALGSTVVFSARGNVVINRTVLEIEGLYSGDRDFIVEGTLPGTDSQLNIRGTAVANAALNGGSFQNQRNLGFANSTTPSVRFVERPDFIVNYPDFVKQSTRVWQEIAP